MPRWLQAVVLVAAVKTVAGFGNLIVHLDPNDSDWDRNLLRIVNVLLFSAASILLFSASRRDRRAAYLGGAFAVTASSSASDGLMLSGLSSLSYLADFARNLGYVNPDAFMPLYFWMFFREFPRIETGFQAGEKLAKHAIKVSVVVGFLLFFLAGIAHSGRVEWISSGFGLLFWAVLALLTLPAIGYANWRVSRASVDERKRVRLFMAGVSLGAGPVFFAFLLGVVSPGFRKILVDPHDRYGLSIALRSLPLLIPVVTTYAILVQDALDLRLVLRKAIRYALARYSALAATVVPFILAAVFVIRHRSQPLSEIMSGGRLPFFMVLTGVGVGLLVCRGSILRGIDRRFFREQYDAYRILHDVVEKCRTVANDDELAALLCDQTDRALHLERVSALFLDSRGQYLKSRGDGVRKLPSSSLLVQMLEGSSEPLEVDLHNPRSPLRRLPEDERQWMVDGAFRLLTPMIGSTGRLLGVLALGEKKSELGFSNEDCALLGSAAASAAGALERILAGPLGSGRRRPPDADPSPSDWPAGECILCGAVYPRPDAGCSACHTGLRPATIPLRPFGKYLLKRRLGAGGMGVVYLARDVELGRDVAIKTLPKISPERSVRLRREARAMASISHPNAALIFAVEFFKGVPLLVLEYLPMGTIRDRLESSRYEVDEVLDLGVSLAGALEAAHASGVLHRDIKPSNVGYDSRGVPKLLDFGLARIIADLRPTHVQTVGTADTTLSDDRESSRVLSMTVGVPGTTAYLAPEAIAGRPPGPSFDLWSLSVLLFETLCGSNPFQGSTPDETRLLILRDGRPLITDWDAECPPPLADFLGRSLDRDPRNRPQTARAFRLELENLKASLAV